MRLACGVLKFREPESMRNVLRTVLKAVTDDDTLPIGSKPSAYLPAVRLNPNLP